MGGASIRQAVYRKRPVPFHTSALTWDVGSVDARIGDEEAARRFEAVYRDLAVRIDDLMQILRGAGGPG